MRMWVVRPVASRVTCLHCSMWTWTAQSCCWSWSSRPPSAPRRATAPSRPRGRGKRWAWGWRRPWCWRGRSSSSLGCRPWRRRTWRRIQQWREQSLHASYLGGDKIISQFRFYLLLTNSRHLFLVECFGDVILVRDVVVNISAPRLHWWHVDLDQPGERDLSVLGVIIQLLPKVALSEQSPGPCEVQRALVQVLVTDVSLQTNKVLVFSFWWFQIFATSPGQGWSEQLRLLVCSLPLYLTLNIAGPRAQDGARYQHFEHNSSFQASLIIRSGGKLRHWECALYTLCVRHNSQLLTTENNRWNLHQIDLLFSIICSQSRAVWQ